MAIHFEHTYDLCEIINNNIGNNNNNKLSLSNNSLALGEELGLADDAGGAAWNFGLMLGWFWGRDGLSCHWELLSSSRNSWE